MGLGEDGVVNIFSVFSQDIILQLSMFLNLARIINSYSLNIQVLPFMYSAGSFF